MNDLSAGTQPGAAVYRHMNIYLDYHSIYITVAFKAQYNSRSDYFAFALGKHQMVWGRFRSSLKLPLSTHDQLLLGSQQV